MPHRPHELDGAPTLHDVRAGDVMSTPIVTCHADVPLAEVAELMARHRIHAVVVLGDPGPDGRNAPLQVVAELELVRAATSGDAAITAGRIGASAPVTIDRTEPLEQAALLMSEYDTTHVIVVESGHPVGILSALDVATALAPPPPPADAGTTAAANPAARPGDRLIIRGHRLAELPRDAEILETRGPDGGPPYLVRWEDNGHVTLLYPGSDARVEHLGADA